MSADRVRSPADEDALTEAALLDLVLGLHPDHLTSDELAREMAVDSPTAAEDDLWSVRSAVSYAAALFAASARSSRPHTLPCVSRRSSSDRPIYPQTAPKPLAASCPLCSKPSLHHAGLHVVVPPVSHSMIP